MDRPRDDAGEDPAGEDPRRLRARAAAHHRDDASANLQQLRARAATRGVNPVVYRLVRAVLLPFFLVYFRLERIGAEHIPRSGPLLLAANHRSFLDPFVIGALSRRPVYYVAKRELFARRWQARALNALGAFPIDRGAGDDDAMAAARAILRRGDCVVIFPEGTRVRCGPLGSPRRGVGRLALETGVRIVPVAVTGTEDVRRGWRIRPRKVRLRCGAPLSFPIVPTPSPGLAATVTERVWARVGLQWAWLCGAPSRTRHEHAYREARRLRGAEGGFRVERGSRSDRKPRVEHGSRSEGESRVEHESRASREARAA